MPAAYVTADQPGPEETCPPGRRAFRLPLLPAGVAWIIGGLLLAAAPAVATDLPPALIADFTRQVQPLLLNKCAAGACHGGASSPTPRFIRAGVSGQFDRTTTLVNMAALDEAIRQSGSHRSFLTTISGRHPADAGSTRLTLAPLTPAERGVLDRWLVASAERRGPPRLLPAQPEPDRLATESTLPTDRAAPKTPPGDTKPIPKADVKTASGETPAEQKPKPSPKPDAKSRVPTAAADPSRPTTAPPPRPNRFRALIDGAANPLPLPPPEKPRGVLLGPAEE